MSGHLSPLPRGMSPGFYAFMAAAGAPQNETGERLMWIEDEPEQPEDSEESDET